MKMEEKTGFEQHAQQVATSQEHANEIQRTRVGGLGGSDVDILLRIGRNGLGALSATDTKRLAVMMGMAEQEEWGGNLYTDAGHAFEDFIAETAPLGDAVRMERETFIEKKLAKNFKTFAHADFTIKSGRAFKVLECKYVQKDTDAVAAEYAAQLQWYYILGAKDVTLCHGAGAVPFDSKQVTADLMQIERNEELCKLILAGLKTLDDAIADGWKPITPDKCAVEDTSVTVQRAFETLAKVKEQRILLDKEEEDAKQIIMSYMRDMSYSSIFNDEHSATIVRESVARTFDKAKLFKAHPEFDTDEFYKQTTRKASLTFK